MSKKHRKWRFSNSPNSLIFMILSVSALLMLWISNSPFIDPRKKSDQMFGSGLDSDQIRRKGHQLYNTNCLNCHGVNGRGTSFGPPLIHPLYEAGNLSDQGFIQAIFYGAPEQHWSYGAMEPISDLSQVEAAHILAYIRAQQTMRNNP